MNEQNAVGVSQEGLADWRIRRDCCRLMLQFFNDNFCGKRGLIPIQGFRFPDLDRLHRDISRTGRHPVHHTPVGPMKLLKVPCGGGRIHRG